MDKTIFLADENVRIEVVRYFQGLGYDIRYPEKGTKNGDLFSLLIHEERILFTHDNDFTDSKRYPAAKTKGIVILKIHPPTPEKIIKALENLFENLPPETLSGKLILLRETEFKIID